MQNRERCLGGFFLSADIPVVLQEGSDIFNNWKPPEGKTLKSWVLSLTQKGKGKPQQGIFCCFKYAHCTFRQDTHDVFPALSLCPAHCSALHGHLLPAPGEDSQSSALPQGHSTDTFLPKPGCLKHYKNEPALLPFML